MTESGKMFVANITGGIGDDDDERVSPGNDAAATHV
jgi:hypothetical protein